MAFIFTKGWGGWVKEDIFGNFLKRVFTLLGVPKGVNLHFLPKPQSVDQKVSI
jgi:hypothetical protein